MKNRGSLLDALEYNNLPGIGAALKEERRDLAIRGGPFTEKEKRELLSYCETDVVALCRLYEKMESKIEWQQALFRGEYTKSVSLMEHWGIPIDTETFFKLRDNWDLVEEKLIATVNEKYQVFEGRTFKLKLFEEWLKREKISWPRTPTGRPKTDEQTFKDMSRTYPQISALKEVKTTRGKIRLKRLAVGSDGRNRTKIWAFKAKTGRNLPSSAEFVFGPATWVRSFIKPEPGEAVSYIDYSAQEWGIAAALSKDPKMLEAYSSGDPYLSFGIQTGLLPPDATREKFKQEREQLKQFSLAINYGQGARSMAVNNDISLARAKQIKRLHRNTYPTYWDWTKRVLDHAALDKKLRTCVDWQIHVNGASNPRSLINWPVQSTGSSMLRMAICFLIQAGIRVIAPVHDALMMQSSMERIEEDTTEAQKIMEDVSFEILKRLRLRTDAQIVNYPDRYCDGRGREVWETITNILAEIGN